MAYQSDAETCPVHLCACSIFVTVVSFIGVQTVSTDGNPLQFSVLSKKAHTSLEAVHLLGEGIVVFIITMVKLIELHESIMFASIEFEFLNAYLF